MKASLKITGETQRAFAIQQLREIPLEPVHELRISEWKETRRTIQNSKMWAMLTDISEQVNWHGQKLSKENWKDVFTASLKQQRVVPGLDSGFVVLGDHTSTMSVAEMAELIELMIAFGTQQGVKWKAPDWMEDN